MPAGNGQLGVADIPDRSVYRAPQVEPALNPVHLSEFLPREQAGRRDQGGGLNDINYNDFMEALNDFDRDGFMDILNDMRREEARNLGGARGNAWDFGI